MNLADVPWLALGAALFTWLMMGFSTRRLCQRGDYCGRFYWWIGWTACAWTSPDYTCWAMRCQPCQWLAQQLHALSEA